MGIPRFIVNERGTPEPPTDVVARLRRVDPHLSLRYFGGFNGAGHWGLVWSWPQSDPRWAEVQGQRVDPEKAFDIIGWVPMDCPVEQVPAYVERALRTFPREDVQRVASQMVQWNTEGVAQQQVADAAAEAAEDIARSNIIAISSAPKGRRKRAS